MSVQILIQRSTRIGREGPPQSALACCASQLLFASAGMVGTALAARCMAAADEVKAAIGTLRACVQAAATNTERCCMLLRTAGAAAAALDQAVTRLQSISEAHKLHALCAAGLAATDMAITQVKVRGGVHYWATAAAIDCQLRAFARGFNQLCVVLTGARAPFQMERGILWQ